MDQVFELTTLIIVIAVDLKIANLLNFAAFHYVF